MTNIKELIRTGKTQEAIQLLTEQTKDDTKCNDETYYLLGNAYRKQGNWQMALNNYLEAIDRNPNSPAVEARNILMDILNFYNKDMYNQ